MVPVSLKGLAALFLWVLILIGGSLGFLRKRRVPPLETPAFRGLVLLIGLLALGLAWRTSIPLFPIVLGRSWTWFPLLFTAGLLALFVFRPLWGLGFTGLLALAAALLYEQRLSLPLEYGTLLLIWMLTAYTLYRYWSNHRLIYLMASAFTGLVSVFVLLLADLIWSMDLAIGWGTLLELGRTLLFQRLPLRFVEILLGGGALNLFHVLWQRRFGPGYDQPLWRPLRWEPPLHHLFFTIALPLGLVLWSFLGLMGIQMVEQQVRRQIQEQLSSIVQDMDYQVTYLVESAQMELESLAQRPQWETLEGEDIVPQLAAFLEGSRVFHHLMLVDTEGRLLGEARQKGVPSRGLSPRERSLIHIFAQTPTLNYAEVVETPPAETSYITFMARVAHQPDRVLLGRVWLARSPLMEPVLRDLRHIKETFHGRGFLLDVDGGLLVLEPEDRSFMNMLTFEVLPQFETSPAEEASSALQWVQLAQGQWFVGFLHPIPGYSWNVLILIPLPYLHQVAGQLGQSLLAWSAIAWVAIMFMGLLVLSWVTRSLRELSREAQRLSQGDLDHPLSPGGVAEVHLLRKSFEDMRQSLKRRLGELQRLLDVGQRLVATLDWNTVVLPVLEGALHLPEATAARVALMVDFCPSDLQTTPQRFFGLGAGHVRLAPLDELLLHRLTREDYRIEPLVQLWTLPLPPPWQEDPELRQAQVLLLPLWHQERPMGVFYVLFRHPPAQWDGPLRYYRALSELLRLALSSARLFAQAVTDRQRLEAILWSTPDAIFMTDNSLRVALANLSARRLLGWPEDAHLPLQEFRVPFAQKELMEMLLTAVDTPQSREITAPDGRVFFATVAPVRVEGRQVGLVGILRDITPLKEAEAARVDFMAGISHDLRSPLSVIQGYASMLVENPQLTEKQRDYLQSILMAVHQMTSMVDNLLELSRMDRGMVEPYFESLPVRDMVMAVLRSHQIQARKKRIRLEAWFDDDAPTFVEADRSLLQRALQNLVDNAIKFTPEGGRVTVRVMPKGHDRVLIVVEDTGIGIEPADRERLFERFYQAENVRRMGLGGKGLGLAIVKSVVEMHHGVIWVESQVNQGSRFFIELPLRQPKTEPHPSVSP